jgi:hypothetical protein
MRRVLNNESMPEEKDTALALDGAEPLPALD